MVLVDTSVWVRALAAKQPYAARVDQLLQEEVLIGHEMVYGELMIGDAGARTKLLASYVMLTYAKTVAHHEVVELVRARRLYGKRIGWIDAHLLAAALVHGAQLYTADAPLELHATALGIAYAG